MFLVDFRCKGHYNQDMELMVTCKTLREGDQIAWAGERRTVVKDAFKRFDGRVEFWTRRLWQNGVTMTVVEPDFTVKMFVDVA